MKKPPRKNLPKGPLGWTILIALGLAFGADRVLSRQSVQKTIEKQVERKLTEVTTEAPKDGEVCFSPEGSCDVKLWKFLQTAQTSLDIAIFDLTHDKIGHEIAVASKRIPVRVLVDRRQAKSQHSIVSTLVKAGVNVRYGSQRGIMHNKFVILDGKRIETGSFNYTDGASFRNNENQLYLGDLAIVRQYQARFQTIWGKGKPEDARGVSSRPSE